MYLIDAFKLMRLKTFLGERENIKLKIEPHVLYNQCRGHPTVEWVAMNVVLLVDVWSTSVEHYSSLDALGI
jgi:hypothetical protein